MTNLVFSRQSSTGSSLGGASALEDLDLLFSSVGSLQSAVNFNNTTTGSSLGVDSALEDLDLPSFQT